MGSSFSPHKSLISKSQKTPFPHPGRAATRFDEIDTGFERYQGFGALDLGGAIPGGDQPTEVGLHFHAGRVAFGGPSQVRNGRIVSGAPLRARPVKWGNAGAEDRWPAPDREGQLGEKLGGVSAG